MSSENKKRDNFSPLTVIMLVILSIYVALLLFLLLWAVMQVFKHPLDFNKNPIWFPSSEGTQHGFTTVNFGALFAYSEKTWMGDGATRTRVGFVEIILNSVVYAVGGALVNTAVMGLMAYLTAKYEYFYSKLIYGIVIVVMVIPVVGSQASEIQVLDALGLWNTRFGFVILKAGFVGVYFLVFYETFKGIPMTYTEAAMIDGASDWYIMTEIYLPMVLNVFTTIALITFIQFWNDYQMAMMYMPDYPTLSYFLFRVQNSSTPVIVGREKILLSGPTVKMTATVVLMMPILIIFISLHEKLMGNLSIGGIKG